MALTDPSAQIAPGFGTVSVTLADGSTIAGTLRSETPEELKIAVGTAPPVKVAIGDITTRTKPLSAMPPLGDILKEGELRDLIAFLATLKQPDEQFICSSSVSTLLALVESAGL